jgi:hypothetical protein
MFRPMPDPIEVEVVSIDGAPPPEPPPTEPHPAPPWRALRERVLHLDRRWWPLWLILGTLAFGLLLVAALVFAAGFLLARLLRGLLALVTPVTRSTGHHLHSPPASTRRP